MDAIFHIRRAYAEAFQAYKSLILNATPESFKKKCEAVLVVDGLDNPKPTDWLRVAVWAVEEAQAECERLDALAKQYGID